MKKHGIINSMVFDRFHDLVTDDQLFGSMNTYRMRMSHYIAAKNTEIMRPEDRARMELGLLWVQMVRGTLDNDEPIDWAGIESKIREEDVLLQLEYDIVKAIYLLLIHNDYISAGTLLEQVIRSLKDSAYNFLYAITARALCNVYIMTGDTASAEAYVQDSISIFRRFDNKLLLASSLNSYAVLKKNCCHYDEAERLLMQAMEIFKSIEAPDGEFLCINNLAVIKMKTGHWQKAEHYFKRLQSLEDGLQLTGKNLLIYKVNRAHLHLLRREFSTAEAELMQLAEEASESRALKQRALAREFLGELFLEKGDNQRARFHLEKAMSLAEEIAPESDVMTETLRRLARLHFNEDDIEGSAEIARKCIRLCGRIRDRHELGAVLRVLGDIHARNNLPRKAKSCYEFSAAIFKALHERYELMRTYISFGAQNIEVPNETTMSPLLEAKNLAEQLGLRYFSAVSMILLGRRATQLRNFNEARLYYRGARDIMDSLAGRDAARLKSSLREAYRGLDKAVVSASVGSAQKLRILGKIYAEARFPVEEAGPRLATDVARNVDAESLFLVRKRNGGYAIPVKYNISIDKARRLTKRLDNGNGKRLFGGKHPVIASIGNGKKLVSVASQRTNHDSLCVIMDESKRLTEKEMEFLLACSEAMEQVAEEQLNRKSLVNRSDAIVADGEHPGERFSRIITVDKQMIRLINLAKRASVTDVPVLLQGETGVGKELFARAIHDTSARRDRNCVAINTGGIPVNFLESELFGHTKGAFTDARMDKPGLVEEAQGGTLFLDEIGDMCEEIQIKLLRLIENGEYRRLGDSRLRSADVRIVSATNKDLPALIKQGKFRKDLYYRVSTVRFIIPPLRYRQDDIELLVRRMIDISLEKLGMPGRIITIDTQAQEALKLYDWPGNVRELQNEILRFVSLLAGEEAVSFAMLSNAIQAYFKCRDRASLHEQKIDHYERMLILQALEANEWNRFKTAEQIGIPRTTLLAKMRRLNITP